jgi:hypothetical protein
MFCYYLYAHGLTFRPEDWTSWELNEELLPNGGFWTAGNTALSPGRLAQIVLWAN